MGTYTTNYNLFMPSVGEQGWGDLVNGNFTTIDTAMKSLSNDIEALETETDAMKETLDSIDFNSDGSVNAGSATQLNKTVNVSSITKTVWIGNKAVYVPCPHVPGILYSGTIKVYGNQGPGVIIVLSSSNTWSETAVSQGSTIEYSITNAKCVVIRCTGSSANDYVTVYLPVYS